MGIPHTQKKIFTRSDPKWTFQCDSEKKEKSLLESDIFMQEVPTEDI